MVGHFPVCLLSGFLQEDATECCCPSLTGFRDFVIGFVAISRNTVSVIRPWTNQRRMTLVQQCMLTVNKLCCTLLSLFMGCFPVLCLLFKLLAFEFHWFMLSGFSNGYILVDADLRSYRFPMKIIWLWIPVFVNFSVIVCSDCRLILSTSSCTNAHVALTGVIQIHKQLFFLLLHSVIFTYKCKHGVILWCNCD